MPTGSWPATGLEVEVHSHCIVVSDVTKQPQGREHRDITGEYFPSKIKQYMGNSYKEVTLVYRYVEILARHPFSLLLFGQMYPSYF